MIYMEKFCDKDKIIDCLLKQSFVFGVYAEIQQFRDGMNMIGGFGNTAFENCQLFDAVLSNKEEKLTFASFKELYRVEFSEVGSNQRQKEEKSIYCFFLVDLSEGNVDSLSLSD